MRSTILVSCTIISPGVEQSYERAFEYYEQAARLGSDKAQNNLGILYYNGQGIETDLKKAKEWLAKAAAQGNENVISKN